MQKPPSPREFNRFPVVSATCALAITLTLCWWAGKIDPAPLMADIGVRRGELWRLLTATLLHANVMHLAFDVYWTWAFGTVVEAAVGSFATLGIFVLLALISSAANFAASDGGIGLSGIGYGLFGLLWVLSRRDKRYANAIDQNTITLFVAWFFLCILLSVLGQPIGNVAHAAGAGAGALLGLAIAAPRRILPWAGLGLSLVVTLLGATVARPWINFSSDRGYDEADAAYSALTAGRNAEALRWSQDAVRMQPKVANFWYNLGVADDRLQREPDAAAAFQKAAELEPTNADYKSAAQSFQSEPATQE